jgi:hypothetical protein
MMGYLFAIIFLLMIWLAPTKQLSGYWDDSFNIADSIRGCEKRPVTRSDFVVGKDRELLHLSIDLKWLYRKIVNKTTWRLILTNAVEKVKRLHPGYNSEAMYRESAVGRMIDIARFNPNFSLR